MCKICKDKRFKHSSALGGHISKAHPGQSSAYNHKKQVRETRRLERQLHQHTLKIYQETQMREQAQAEAENEPKMTMIVTTDPPKKKALN